MKSKPNAFALKIVNKFFPKVTRVVDAALNLEVEVTKRDVTMSTKKDHAGCAMAVACKREHHADGVIMAISTAYVIKGDLATRYLVPASVGREVVSFDRANTFEAGSYHLAKIPKARRLGERQGPDTDGTRKRSADGSRSQHVHTTEGIRAILRNA